jgi:hypothetical protein
MVYMDERVLMEKSLILGIPLVMVVIGFNTGNTIVVMGGIVTFIGGLIQSFVRG